jgi:hypothetical protein
VPTVWACTATSLESFISIPLHCFLRSRTLAIKNYNASCSSVCPKCHIIMPFLFFSISPTHHLIFSLNVKYHFNCVYKSIAFQNTVYKILCGSCCFVFQLFIYLSASFIKVKCLWTPQLCLFYICAWKFWSDYS